MERGEKMETGVVVALIAASASLGGAVTSFLAARRSALAAAETVRRGLVFTEFDKLTQDLRKDYTDFITAVIAHRKRGDDLVFAFAELLRVNPLATSELEDATENMLRAVVGGGVRQEDSTLLFSTLRAEMRSILRQRLEDRKQRLAANNLD
ncbi:MAG: hypothetical protein M9891_01940 [Austwickia sp.]|nr:hypothetical protein [Austwickia sp.]